MIKVFYFIEREHTQAYNASLILSPVWTVRLPIPLPI